jgi:hypothetical protein
VCVVITASTYLALAAAVVVTVAATTLPGALHAAVPYLVAALWAYALWLGRRAGYRHYHRNDRPNALRPMAHRHIKPSRRRRVRLFLRRVRSLRLRTTEIPAAPAAVELEPAHNLTPGQELRQVRESLGSAARVVALDDAVVVPEIRQFARSA